MAVAEEPILSRLDRLDNIVSFFRVENGIFFYLLILLFWSILLSSKGGSDI